MSITKTAVESTFGQRYDDLKYTRLLLFSVPSHAISEFHWFSLPAKGWADIEDLVLRLAHFTNRC